eukprot:GHVS01012972.1.p1 GENE.GHVS01012972.1~~GHVS01012972.1.p1  ORF type:complete len:465 (+),score=15.08 GHVS01012972.1:118-1512(+)
MTVSSDSFGLRGNEDYDDGTQKALLTIHYHQTFIRRRQLAVIKDMPQHGAGRPALAPMGNTPSELTGHDESPSSLTTTDGLEEVFLSPQYIALKLYSLVANFQINFLASQFPYCNSLGHLPAAFVSHAAQTSEDLLTWFASIRDIDHLQSKATLLPLHAENYNFPGEATRKALVTGKSSLAMLSGAADCDIFVYRTIVVEKVSRLINYVLWLYPRCYNNYTKPICSATLPGIFSEWFAYRRKRQMAQTYQHVGLPDIIREMEQVVLILYYRLIRGCAQDGECFSEQATANEQGQDSGMPVASSADRKFYFGDRLTFLDVIVYSYLSVLLNIPTTLTPWGCFYSDELSSSTNLGASMGGLVDMLHGYRSFSENGRVHPIRPRLIHGSGSKPQGGATAWGSCNSYVSSDVDSVPPTKSARRCRLGACVKIGLKRLAQFLCDVDTELWEISMRRQVGNSGSPKLFAN